MRLIINADDLGFNQTINSAIFQSMANGVVTSATLIANAPAFDEAVDTIGQFPKCSFGLHLNLTEFRPITNSTALLPLLAETGDFDDDAVRAVKLTKALRRAIFDEWSAQVSKMVAAGHTPSHLDSHHHIHTVAGLFPTLKKLQRRFGIRRVRLTKNIYGTNYVATRKLLIAKSIWNTALRHCYATRTTDGFTSLEEFADQDSAGRLRQWSTKCIEVMVHPGNPLFQHEQEFLRAEWMTARGITLSSYNNL